VKIVLNEVRLKITDFFEVKMLILDSAFFFLDSTFWLDSTLKIYPVFEYGRGKNLEFDTFDRFPEFANYFKISNNLENENSVNNGVSKLKLFLLHCCVLLTDAPKNITFTKRKTFNVSPLHVSAVCICY